MRYILMHKEIPVCLFDIESEVTGAVFSKAGVDHLPLPLKRVIHFPEEFAEEETSDSIVLNEEGVMLLDLWLNDRTIPANRDNIRKYYSRKYNSLTWMLENHSCSLDDCYWTKRSDEKVTWETVKLFDNDCIDVLYLENLSEDQERHYSGVNATLGGQLEKYWYYEIAEGKKKLFLCKRTDHLSEILNIREVIAAKIYHQAADIEYCTYTYVRNHLGQIAGCSCPAFTAEDKELITAYDLLEEYGLTQQDDVYELIIRCAGLYGLDEETARRYLDSQTMVDYLITNRDRHQGNIGFLRNTDTLKLIAAAPVYDSGSSKEKEFELPEGIMQTTVNGLYPTELECLSHVRNYDEIDFDRLPSKEEILEELKQSSALSESRILQLADLYEGKAAYLRSLREEKRH